MNIVDKFWSMVSCADCVHARELTDGEKRKAVPPGAWLRCALRPPRRLGLRAATGSVWLRAVAF